MEAGRVRVRVERGKTIVELYAKSGKGSDPKPLSFVLEEGDDECIALVHTKANVNISSPKLMALQELGQIDTKDLSVVVEGPYIIFQQLPPGSETHDEPPRSQRIEGV